MVTVIIVLVGVVLAVKFILASADLVHTTTTTISRTIKTTYDAALVSPYIQRKADALIDIRQYLGEQSSIQILWISITSYPFH